MPPSSSAGPTCSPPLAALLAGDPTREERITHVETVPARPGTRVPWPAWVAPELLRAFTRRGVTEPWRHQVVAAEAARAGRHVVVATGTASGKSLAYQLPALGAVLEGRAAGAGRSAATVLYVAPTKALAEDQLHALGDLAVPGLAACTHDGDSSREQRDWARGHAEWLLTNPDMLHHSLLPGHERWGRFLARLRYVVVDECHVYRGVFGAHVALVLRRLRRVAAAHGAHPTFVLASATVADPAVSAGRLTGLPVTAVTDDDAARGAVTVALWQPPLTERRGEAGAPVRRAATAEVAELLADLVTGGVRSLAFARSRRGAESIAMAASRSVTQADPALTETVAAYRGGYLPEDRRALEQGLRDGSLRGLATTNALELGIDVAGLDAVLVAGFPGTRAALWQQVGRAGRAGGDALAVLVARDDPLDTYLVTHPVAVLGGPIEASVFDPGNPHVLGPHLCAAAAELPLQASDLALFGPAAEDGVHALSAAGLLRRRAAGWYWTDGRRASQLADLRSSGGRPVQLVEGGTGRVVGTVDDAAAPAAVHPGAVYVHQGETWLVDELDLEGGTAHLHRAEPDHWTSARTLTDLRILGVREEEAWPGGQVTLGSVRVTSQVVAFLRRRLVDGEVLGEEPLDLPPRSLDTTGVWWTVPEDGLRAAGLARSDLAGGAHAAMHAAIGLLPLFATCDRWDVDGFSTAHHADTGQLTVVVHDNHAGGAGFAEHGYRRARHWFTATHDLVASCGCPSGCPACVQSPGCGSGNQPLDKAAAATLLEVLLGSSAARRAQEASLTR